MGKKQRDKRRFSRVMVAGPTTGRVTALYDTSLVDISLGGVLIEHVQVVRPGTTSSLDFELHGKRLSLKCRVVRSVVHRTEMQPDGEQSLIYHTGLEFLDPAAGMRQLICDYIQSLMENGNETRTVVGEHIPIGALDREG